MDLHSGTDDGSQIPRGSGPVDIGMDPNGAAGECLPDASHAEAEAASGEDVMTLSPKVAERIAEIQARIEDFSDMTSQLLEGGKETVSAAYAAWEQRVMNCYHEQMRKWTDDISLLEAMGHTNTNLERRLHHAQSAFNLMCPPATEAVEGQFPPQDSQSQGKATAAPSPAIQEE